MIQRAVLLSTYELGRQPFGLASPAAWLREAGINVTCLDLSITPLADQQVADADLVAFYLPMHTATRIAAPVITQVRAANPQVYICCYGLYAPMNADFLRRLGADSFLGGEFEAELLSLARRLGPIRSSRLETSQAVEVISYDRLHFRIPDRSDLPPLAQYARLVLGTGNWRTTGYTEASRGCKHHCRHCPIVPIYKGRFRIVSEDVVLEDIRQQVNAGAEHITFGDPDFLNGPGHSLPLVRRLHEAFPDLTYDVTIKIEHLLRYPDALPILRDTGCLFVTSAVESLDDRMLLRLAKGHTRADFFAVAERFKITGLTLNPTFVAFHPWSTLEGYVEFLEVIENIDLVEAVSPVQYAIRLLIPRGSELLALDEVQRLIGPFDETALSYCWEHVDPRVDRLYHQVRDWIRDSQKSGLTRRQIFEGVLHLARLYAGVETNRSARKANSMVTKPVPYLSEPWYC